MLEKDEDKGQIFIRPASAESTKPINLFISSDRGTVALLLQAIDAPSDTIVIREVGGTRQRGFARSAQPPACAHGQEPLARDGDRRAPRRHADSRASSGPHLVARRANDPAAGLPGPDVIGEKYQLSNVGAVEFSLTGRDLYKPNVFVIRERHADE